MESHFSNKQLTPNTFRQMDAVQIAMPFTYHTWMNQQSESMLFAARELSRFFTKDNAVKNLSVLGHKVELGLIKQAFIIVITK